jgi:flagellar basal body rod protein FlgB
LRFKDFYREIVLINNIGQMDLSSLIRDNIDDILVKIIQFTHIRHRIILENIENCHTVGFVPRQVNVEDFAKVISVALSEHQRTNRLVLCDSETVIFSSGGRLSIKPQIDTAAHRLFKEDFDRYICQQRQELNENAINNRTACALFGHKLRSARIPAR